MHSSELRCMKAFLIGVLAVVLVLLLHSHPAVRVTALPTSNRPPSLNEEGETRAQSQGGNLISNMRDELRESANPQSIPLANQERPSSTLSQTSRLVHSYPSQVSRKRLLNPEEIEDNKEDSDYESEDESPQVPSSGLTRKRIRPFSRVPKYISSALTSEQFEFIQKLHEEEKLPWASICNALKQKFNVDMTHQALVHQYIQSLKFRGSLRGAGWTAAEDLPLLKFIKYENVYRLHPTDIVVPDRTFQSTKQRLSRLRIKLLKGEIKFADVPDIDDLQAELSGTQDVSLPYLKIRTDTPSGPTDSLVKYPPWSAEEELPLLKMIKYEQKYHLCSTDIFIPDRTQQSIKQHICRLRTKIKLGELALEDVPNIDDLSSELAGTQDKSRPHLVINLNGPSIARQETVSTLPAQLGSLSSLALAHRPRQLSWSDAEVLPLLKLIKHGEANQLTLANVFPGRSYDSMQKRLQRLRTLIQNGDIHLDQVEGIDDLADLISTQDSSIPHLSKTTLPRSRNHRSGVKKIARTYRKSINEEDESDLSESQDFSVHEPVEKENTLVFKRRSSRSHCKTPQSDGLPEDNKDLHERLSGPRSEQDPRWPVDLLRNTKLTENEGSLLDIDRIYDLPCLTDSPQAKMPALPASLEASEHILTHAKLDVQPVFGYQTDWEDWEDHLLTQFIRDRMHGVTASIESLPISRPLESVLKRLHSLRKTMAAEDPEYRAYINQDSIKAAFRKRKISARDAALKYLDVKLALMVDEIDDEEVENDGDGKRRRYGNLWSVWERRLVFEMLRDAMLSGGLMKELKDIKRSMPSYRSFLNHMRTDIETLFPGSGIMDLKWESPGNWSKWKSIPFEDLIREPFVPEVKAELQADEVSRESVDWILDEPSKIRKGRRTVGRRPSDRFARSSDILSSAYSSFDNLRLVIPLSASPGSPRRPSDPIELNDQLPASDSVFKVRTPAVIQPLALANPTHRGLLPLVTDKAGVQEEINSAMKTDMMIHSKSGDADPLPIASTLMDPSSPQFKGHLKSNGWSYPDGPIPPSKNFFFNFLRPPPSPYFGGHFAYSHAPAQGYTSGTSLLMTEN